MTCLIETARNDLLAFDQSQADATWEWTQEQALRAFRARGVGAAKSSWARALKIAKDHFERGDPRIAASCTNQAFALIRQKQIHQGTRLLDEALRCWEDSWCWVPLMVPPRLGDQIEDSHYNEATRKKFYAFIKHGRSITETLARDHRLPTGGLEDWLEHKPKTMSDVRKLVASVFLIASEKP